MNVFKRILNNTISSLIITSILIFSTIEISNATPSITNTRRPVKIGVLAYNYNNAFSSLIKKSFEDIQKENENKVEFTFFDGQSNPAIESEILNNMIQNNYDLILASIVDKNEQGIIENFVYKAKQKGVPLVFFNISPAKLDVIKESSKSLIVNPDANQAGALQGKMIADAWNANKQIMDRNGDNIMQYVLLKGQLESFPVKERSNSSISAISDAGIKTEKLQEVSANWDEEVAKSTVESLFLKYGNKIEVIIASNDSMAIGAIKALQRYGYNMGDKGKTIPVFGINAIPESKDFIEKGFMAGTIPQNPRILVDAVYTIGMNLVSDKSPLEGTNYKFDKNGVIVTVPIAIPYSENIST